MKNDIETTITYFQDSANSMLFYLSALDICFKDDHFNSEIRQLCNHILVINEYINEELI